MKTIPVVLLTLAIAVPATWLATKQIHRPEPKPKAAGVERKLLYYQSAMHPWIKSDKPGRCTICGMELTPVYEGDAGFDTAGGDMVPLSATMIQVLNVQTAEARVQPIGKTLAVAGTIEENATRHQVLSAYLAGRIQKLHVNYVGAEVKQGEPLAEFYSPALLQAEREYRTLTGELREATELRLLQMGLTAAQIGALSNKPGDQLTSQILAPMGGTVVARNVYEGQYVEEGEKLFEIADFSTMWFQFRAYEQDLPWIKIGLKVDVTTPAHPGKTFSGTISFIDPNFDETTRSTKVRVELENPLIDGKRLLLSGLYADALVRLEEHEALSIPRTAVIETGAEAISYVDEGGGAYSRRVISLGSRGDTLVEVTAGLNAGEKVVVQGNLLIDGQAEMNRASARQTEMSIAAEKLAALTEPERKAVHDFLALMDGMSAALAADNVGEFNTLAVKMPAATSALVSVFNESSPWHPLVHPLALVIQPGNATDLKQARKQFYSLSIGAVELAQTLRGADSRFASLKVFQCPMTRNVFDGAPRSAEWVQLQLPIRNPWMGSRMLDCGTELGPPKGTKGAK